MPSRNKLFCHPSLGNNMCICICPNIPTSSCWECISFIKEPVWGQFDHWDVWRFQGVSFPLLSHHARVKSTQMKGQIPETALRRSPFLLEKKRLKRCPKKLFFVLFSTRVRWETIPSTHPPKSSPSSAFAFRSTKKWCELLFLSPTTTAEHWKIPNIWYGNITGKSCL